MQTERQAAGTGAGAAAIEVLPFNGWFFTRERGLWGYLSAVWAFLAGNALRAPPPGLLGG